MSKSNIIRTKNPSRQLTWAEAMEIAQEEMPGRRHHWDSYARTLVEMDRMFVAGAKHRERVRKERSDEAHLDLITARAVKPSARMFELIAKPTLSESEQVELELLIADAEARADALLGKEG